ncbi:hypothetical protein K438DRAFT_773588 [Mycena galopus ATCC 62051]|nr:hypothetical protein K438DRAFT_773588 [Mycena galopus ATCC 62051]
MSTAQVSQTSTVGNTAPECIGHDIAPASAVNRTEACWDPLTGTSGPPASRTTAFTYTPGETLRGNTGDNQLNEPPASRAPVTAPTATGSEAATQLNEFIARIQALETALRRIPGDDQVEALSRRMAALHGENMLALARIERANDAISRRIDRECADHLTRSDASDRFNNFHFRIEALEACSTLRNTAPESIVDDSANGSGSNQTEAPCWDPLTSTSGPPASGTTGFAPTRGKTLRRNTDDSQLTELPASRTTVTSTGSVNQLDELIARIESLEAANYNSANELSCPIESLQEANFLLRTRAENSVNEFSRRIAALERQNSEQSPESPQVKLTPWRVTNTAVLLGLGVYKAAGTYLGQTTGPNTADWIVGVLWALIVYWVEPMVPFYEEHRAEDDSESGEFSLHWLLAHEVSSALLVVPLSVVMLLCAYLAATLRCQSTNKFAKFRV